MGAPTLCVAIDLENHYTCPNCGWRDSRLSHSSGFADRVLALVFLVPIRCRKCLKRFYRFRNSGAKYAVAAMLLATILLLSLSYNWVSSRRHIRTNRPASATTGEADRRR